MKQEFCVTFFSLFILVFCLKNNIEDIGFVIFIIAFSDKPIFAFKGKKEYFDEFTR